LLLEKTNMAEERAQALTLAAQQAQIVVERQERIAEHKRAVAARNLGQRTLEARAANAPLNVLAEGDSWFDYPLFRDTIEWIREIGNPEPEILSLAHHGDAAVDMLGVAQRARIIENLQDADNGAFDALLFSGGGNDIAGDRFCLWVLKFVTGSDPAHGVDRQRLSDMNGVIRAAYVDLFRIRDEIAPGCAIFLHGYDFALPTGEGVCGFGPWLKPSLDFRGWTTPSTAAGIVKEVLLSFDKLLAQLEQQFPNVVYVRTQGTLSADDWANELHPTRTGFQKIANVFVRALRTKFPGRI
jgi:hypothetical protein